MEKTKKIELINSIEIAVAVSLFLSFFIFFIPSPNHEIRIHDTFDGNFSTRHVLIQSGHLFDFNPNTIVPGIMNGLPRGVLMRNTEITSILMYLFGSLNGYAITFVIVRLIAFLGIFLFALYHIDGNKKYRGVVFMVATAFACLPFFVIHGLTVAGIPIVLWAFVNIYKKQKYFISYSVVVLFVAWSNFVLVGFHLLLLLGIISLIYSILDKKIHYNLFIFLFVILILYIASDYMLFYMHYFNPSFVTSRDAVEKTLGLNIKGVIGTSFLSFFTGDYSSAGYLGYVYLPLFALFGYFIFNKRITIQNIIISQLIIAYILCSVLINFLDWKGLAFFYEKVAFAKVFNFKRFTNLLPGLFFLISTAVFIYLIKLEKIGIRILISGLSIVLFAFILRGNSSLNRSAFNTTGLKIEGDEQVTYNHFFDKSLYSEIKKEIGNDSVLNVIHYGLSPSASKLAGLNVLDDYQGDYPKAYKDDFRKIIEKELAKSSNLSDYFDKWGARCYMFSANNFESKLSTINGIKHDKFLQIDVTQLKKMKCRYILSSIVIENKNDLNLNLKRIFFSNLTNKIIFLYYIN